MKSEIQEAEVIDSQQIVVSSQLEQFKSLYYLLKGKRDTDIKLFKDFKQFRYRDIIELNTKVYKKLELHKLVTDTNTVTISLSNKEIKSFGSWKEFLNFDRNISATTDCITIEWDFNILLPNQTHELPQTHTLRVRIGNGLRPNEVIQIIFQGGEETDFEEAQAQVVCKIDFVNSQICNELKMLVTEWYDSLPNNSEDHRIIKILLGNRRKIQQIVIMLLLVSGITILNFIAHYLIKRIPILNESELLSTFYLISTCSLVVMYFFYITGKFFAERILEKRIGNLKRDPMFEFTKGDENKLIDTRKNNKAQLIKLLRDLAIVIIINIIAYGVGKIFPTIAELIK